MHKFIYNVVKRIFTILNYEYLVNRTSFDINIYEQKQQNNNKSRKRKNIWNDVNFIMIN